MTSSAREQLLRAIEDLGKRYPHWRLGQLVCNVAGWADADLWEAEDRQLLEAIRNQQEYERSAMAQPSDNAERGASGVC